MGGPGGVGRRIVGQGIESSRKWRRFGQARKDNSIADIIFEQEGGALRHLQGVKLRRGSAHAGFNLGRARPLD